MDAPPENTRKRPRPSSSTTQKRGSLDLALPTSVVTKREPDPAGEQQASRLRDPVLRTTELNNLLRLSCSNESCVLKSSAIVDALADIVVTECLGWDDDAIERLCPASTSSAPLVFRSSQAWNKPPTPSLQAWAEFCRNHHGEKPPTNDDTWRMLEAVVVILRNFSYMSSNVRLLAYSSTVHCVITACLYLSSSSGSYKRYCQRRQQNEQPLALPLAASSLQTLVHIARHVDVTGQLIVVDKFFYDASATVGGPVVPGQDFGQCLSGQWGGLGACWLSKKLDSKEDTMESLPTSLLVEVAGDYLVAVWSLFPALGTVLTVADAPRSVVLLALDVLLEFLSMARVGLVGSLQEESTNEDAGSNNPEAEIPTMRAVLAHIPQDVLHRLTSLLFIPKAGNESLE